jgi:hypothetical protein
MEGSAPQPATRSKLQPDRRNPTADRFFNSLLELLLRSHMDSLPQPAYGDKLVRSDLQGLDLDQFDVARLQLAWHEAWEYHDCHY